MGSVKKNFILDTNVILHDHECIEKFQENDIYIPITVLEELDKFKKGTEQVNYNARAFIRKLDNLTNEDFFFCKRRFDRRRRRQAFHLHAQCYSQKSAGGFPLCHTGPSYPVCCV